MLFGTRRHHQPRHLHPLAGLGAAGAIVVLGRLRARRSSPSGLRPLRPRAAGRRPARSCPILWIALALLVVPIAPRRPPAGPPDRPRLPDAAALQLPGRRFIDNSLIALWLALSLYTGAFIAEIVRAGIHAVSRGQTEAACALGLRPGRTMRLVILPQALRVIIPPLISQYLNLTKNSSLAIAVGYMDVRATLGGITMNQTGRELECMLLLMRFYLVVSLLISSVMNFYNARVALKER